MGQLCFRGNIVKREVLDQNRLWLLPTKGNKEVTLKEVTLGHLGGSVG